MEILKCFFEELKPKYTGYRSYKVELPYSSKENIFDSSLWPENVLVNKLFFPKSNKSPSKTGSFHQNGKNL